MNPEGLLSIIHQSSLAILSVFFGMYAIAVAFLANTLNQLDQAERDYAKIAADFKRSAENLDPLNSERIRLQLAQHDMHTQLAAYENRARLLKLTIGLLIGLIVLSTSTSAYSYYLLRRNVEVETFLNRLFYSLIFAPMISAILLTIGLKRTGYSELERA